MPFGYKGSDEKYACDGVFNLVQYRVEMRTGNRKVSGALG
jgi:hypothetical protein